MRQKVDEGNKESKKRRHLGFARWKKRQKGRKNGRGAKNWREGNRGRRKQIRKRE